MKKIYYKSGNVFGFVQAKDTVSVEAALKGIIGDQISQEEYDTAQEDKKQRELEMIRALRKAQE